MTIRPDILFLDMFFLDFIHLSADSLTLPEPIHYVRSFTLKEYIGDRMGVLRRFGIDLDDEGAAVFRGPRDIPVRWFR